MSRRWTRAELQAGERIWLLTIEHAGRVLRWASTDCAPIDADGNALPHSAGLDTDPPEVAMQGPGGEPVVPSITAEVFWPADVDLAALIEQGHELIGATAELALWVDGSTYDQRRVTIAGTITAATYGDADEPVEIQIDARPWRREVLLPTEAARITAERWPTAPEDSLEQYAVIPIGYPGAMDDGTLVEGIPVFPVAATAGEVDLLAVCEGRVGATSVQVFPEGQASFSASVAHTAAGDGRTWATVDISGRSTAERTADSYAVAFPRSGAGGIQYRGRTLDGAGDVLRWALEQEGLDIDRGGFAAVAGELNRYALAGCIETPSPIYDWLTDGVLPGLPVELLYQTGEVTPIIWRVDATEALAIAHLEVGRNCEPVGPITYGGTRGQTNEVAVEYALDTEGKTRAAYVVGIDGEVSSVAARSGRQRYGRQAVTLALPMVWRSSTASQIAAASIRATALPHRIVAVEGLAEDLGVLLPGDVVTFTDEARAIDARVALVRSVRWVDDGCEVDLLIYRQPGRDPRR